MSRCIASHIPCLHLWSEKRQTTSTTLHSLKLTFESSVANSLNKKTYLQATYLQAVSQKHQTVLAKLELPHFIETAFEQASIVGYSFRFRKQSSVTFNHWFLVSSVGSPNKVLSLSQWNTASPGHGAGSSNDTAARIIIPPFFFAYTFGSCFANLPTPWHRHVRACLI